MSLKPLIGGAEESLVARTRGFWYGPVSLFSVLSFSRVSLPCLVSFMVHSGFRI